MEIKNCRFENEPGFTLIETLITLAILMLVMLGLGGLGRLIFKANLESRARITATALANERLETVRNLPYVSIGTLNGIPPGTLPQTETRLVNGISYMVKTAVTYVDDAFDGLAPADPINTDYKSVRVEVDWSDPPPSSQPVIFYTKAAPKGLETPSSGGTIKVSVFDASAAPLAGAEAHIIGEGLNPPVDITQNTAANGELVLPGAPVCNSCYRISVTKAGYSLDRTYNSAEVHSPIRPPATVLAGELTEVSFTIDRLASLLIRAQTATLPAQPLPALNIRLAGAKIIGQDEGGSPVYKFIEELVTDANGVVVRNDLEWDSYTLTVDGSATGYDLVEAVPFEAPLALAPGAGVTELMTLTNHAAANLRVYVKNNLNQPLVEAAVRLTGPPAYEETLVTGSAGQVFFSPLAQALYTLDITTAGYEALNDSAAVSGNELRVFVLNPL